MKNTKLPLIFTVMLLTACDGESQIEPNEEIPQETVSPVEGVTPAITSDTTEASERGEYAVIDPGMTVPGSLKITKKGSDIKLNWGYIPQATAYNVYYNEGEDVNQSGVLFTTSQTRFTHQGLSESLHSYKVQAVYQNGQVLSNLSAKLQADLAKQVKLED
ncbi:hypothetical protein [Thalassotalea sp. ND16A]|uniref:hypothetical protein n=1 Tax=Thalassotalea sp. ND16A TaxID=1535422 RepID=UPI000519F94D|nr:hypothetical protein [Thalassotalea sp. ND16A]KGK00095.1 hypothetical protein ND16A_0286 [Thalassotalea sp. ND16A]